MKKILRQNNVAPLAGAWIEIKWTGCDTLHNDASLPSRERGLKLKILQNLLIIPSVAPLAGAWIEIFHERGYQYRHKSLPSRERGLKSLRILLLVTRFFSRSPRGSVD